MRADHVRNGTTDERAPLKEMLVKRSANRSQAALGGIGWLSNAEAISRDTVGVDDGEGAGRRLPRNAERFLGIEGVVLALQQEIGVVPTQGVVNEEARCRGMVNVHTEGPGGIRRNGRAGNVIRQVVGRRDGPGRARVGPLEVKRHVQLLTNVLIDLDRGDIGYASLVE